MNRLVIIGNGFDLAHGLKTSYKDFINWYKEQVVKDLKDESYNAWKDELCSIELLNTYQPHLYIFMSDNSIYKNKSGVEIFDEIDKDYNNFNVKKSPLLERILKNIEDKGWTDIESDYYELLKENANDIETCRSLNEQLDFLKDKLVEYLKTQTTEKRIENIKAILEADIEEEDIAQSSIKVIETTIPDSFRVLGQEHRYLENLSKVNDTVLLDFNYTNTTNLYRGKNISINHIHGSLKNPKNIIFGYGDEMDKDYQELIDKNENELLRNSKSVKYLETSNYRKLLQFIDGGLFQVYIIGHSCGNSDRTLLNTIFEHNNCVSIKPFCYVDEKGKDNYSELTQNIYRNFTDKKLFRDRVVNKERCTTLEGGNLNL